MAIAREDIKPGWYWIQNRLERKLFVVKVAPDPTFETIDSVALIVWHHGWEFETDLSEALGVCDFIARIEPPEGV
jgi:hypothetical protein